MKLSEGWPRRSTLFVALLALAVPLLSCGDDTPSKPVTIVAPMPVRGVLAETSFSGFQTDLWVSIEILVSQKGDVDVTVDWTFPDSWIYVYFGNTQCSRQQLAGNTCPFLVSSETQTPKPRTFRTGILEPGTYYLMLYNVPRNLPLGIGSDNTEAVAIQLGLTVYPFTSAPGPGSAIQVGRVQAITPRP